MQSPSFVQQVIAEVAPVLITLLGTILTLALTAVANELRKKITSSTGLDVLNKFAHLSEMTVLNLQQTMVDEMKARSADGVLSSDDVIHVKTTALLKVKAALSEKGLDQAMAALGYKDRDQLDQLISSQIEAAVARARTYLGKKLTVQASVGAGEVGRVTGEVGTEG